MFSVCDIDKFDWSEAYKRRLRERVALNRAVLTNKYYYYPVLDGHDEYVQVGSGDVSSNLCAKWVRNVRRCRDEGSHAGKFLDGVDATGKNVIVKRHLFCKNPLCVKCWLRGFSVRLARSGEARLDTGVRLGVGKKVEHLTCSPSVEDRALSQKELRRKCEQALMSRGVYGFAMVWHARRLDRKRKGLVYSPHFHVAGFLKDDFDRCRNCVDRVCEGLGNEGKCDGFEARTRREFKNDGVIVKVHEERKTVFGTLYYVLTHTSVKLTFLNRTHCVTWHGACSNKQYKTVPVKVEVPCKVCGGKMVNDVYIGKRPLVTDIGHPAYRSVVLVDSFDEDGEPNFLSDFEKRRVAEERRKFDERRRSGVFEGRGEGGLA